MRHTTTRGAPLRTSRPTKNNFFDMPNWFAFLLPVLIKQQRVPVYPVKGVFLPEIRGKDDQVHAL